MNILNNLIISSTASPVKTRWSPDIIISGVVEDGVLMLGRRPREPGRSSGLLRPRRNGKGWEWCLLLRVSWENVDQSVRAMNALGFTV